MKEELILVDDNDNPIGTASREECHKGLGKRHRAFVIFLFDKKGRLLLQFRNKNKLGGKRWDVTATSHVRKDETYESAAQRCLTHELGVSIPLEKIEGGFTYIENFDGFSENEYCAVLIGKYDGQVMLNKSELDEVKYATLNEIERDLSTNAKSYTKWFREGFGLLKNFVMKSGYLDD